MWNRALVDASNVNGVISSDEKYSISYTTDTVPVVVINEDILANKKRSEWENIVKGEIGKFKNGIPVGNNVIYTNSKTVREYSRSQYTQKLFNKFPEIYKDKLRVAKYLDEVVIASTDYVNEEIKHERKDSFVQFARGNVLLNIENKKYIADVIIGYTKGDNLYLYDVINIVKANYEIKRSSNVYQLKPNGSHQQTRATSSNIKSQNETDVNENDSTEFSIDALYSSEGNKFSPRYILATTLLDTVTNTEEYANLVERCTIFRGSFNQFLLIFFYRW